MLNASTNWNRNLSSSALAQSLHSSLISQISVHEFTLLPLGTSFVKRWHRETSCGQHGSNSGRFNRGSIFISSAVSAPANKPHLDRLRGDITVSLNAPISSGCWFTAAAKVLVAAAPRNAVLRAGISTVPELVVALRMHFQYLGVALGVHPKTLAAHM